MKKLLLNLFMICGLSLIGLTSFGQGVTTSSMNGKVVSDSGEELPGATVIAVHTPSGTQYGSVTDLNGFYRIPNMRVGGPYKVTVNFVGYSTYERAGLFLTLGQTFGLSVKMQETSTQLDEVIVTAGGVIDGNRTGQETIVDAQTIEALPTISRAIGDYARFNPLANIQDNGDGFTISIAGQNNRFNAIYIDGAVNNDVFGLAGNGSNGGQTGVQPISIDAIEQFQISVAPFDVRQSGFAGGSINAVTRSGSNEVEGSAYYFFRNENLAGRTPTDNDGVDREKLSEFSAKTFGFRLGGPIIKDKLFFFVNGERQDDTTPQPFNFANYDGDGSRADIDQLTNFIRTNYNYDAGTFENNEAALESNKFLVKLDWNINKNHKLSVRHSYVRAENLEARNSSSGFLGFLNGSEFFISTTNSSALELNSSFGNNIANKFTIGTTIVRDDRDPLGNPFPTLRIADGDANIEIGAERFSTANLLNQDIITIRNDLELFKGKHSFLFGTNFEYYNVGNLFIRENFGSYRFFNDNNTGVTGLQRFLTNLDANGNPISSRIERSFSQVDNVTGDESNAIADFRQILLGFYVQDEIQVNEKLKVTAGLRVDLPLFLDDQPLNAGFNDSTATKIETIGYDLQGASTGSFIKTQVLFSPRVGVNYDVNGDKSLQLRGGIGLFTSRIPLVWQGGAYNNFGFNIGGTRNNDEPFNPDVNTQFPGNVDQNNLTPSGQIDLFSEDFKLPQLLKINVAVDKKLPWGMIGTLEALYSKNINFVRYENFNLRPPVARLTGGPDDRPLFNDNDLVEPTYTGIYLASNTSKGYAYNFVASVNKPFDNGLSANLSYSFGDAFSVFDGTSSQNNSQWRGYFNVNGRNNNGPAQRSTFSAGHRVLAQASYKKDYLNFGSTQLSLTFDGQSGRPFTYVVGASNNNFVNDGGFDFSELMFIPADASQINLVDDNGVTAAEQWAILNAYIEDDRYLSNNRGEYAERNSDRTPFEAILDLRLLQDFYIKTAGGKKNTLQLSFDIFNFTNFLNSDWGRRRNFRFGTYNLVNLEGFEADGTTPIYTVNSEILNGEDPWDDDINDSGFRSARWQMQIGLRYTFGN